MSQHLVIIKFILDISNKQAILSNMNMLSLVAISTQCKTKTTAILIFTKQNKCKIALISILNNKHNLNNNNNTHHILSQDMILLGIISNSMNILLNPQCIRKICKITISHQLYQILKLMFNTMSCQTKPKNKRVVNQIQLHNKNYNNREVELILEWWIKKIKEEVKYSNNQASSP